MHVQIKENDIPDFEKVVKEGKIFKIWNFIVCPNFLTFKTCMNEHMMQFMFKTHDLDLRGTLSEETDDAWNSVYRWSSIERKISSFPEQTDNTQGNLPEQTDDVWNSICRWTSIERKINSYNFMKWQWIRHGCYQPKVGYTDFFELGVAATSGLDVSVVMRSICMKIMEETNEEVTFERYTRKRVNASLLVDDLRNVYDFHPKLITKAINGERFLYEMIFNIQYDTSTGSHSLINMQTPYKTFCDEDGFVWI